MIKVRLDHPSGSSWNDWIALMEERARRCSVPRFPEYVKTIYDVHVRQFIEAVLFSGNLSPMQQYEMFSGDEKSGGKSRRGGYYGKGHSGQPDRVINPWEKKKKQAHDIKQKISEKRRRAGFGPLQEGPGFLESMRSHEDVMAAQWGVTLTTDAQMTPYAVDLPTMGTPHYLRHGWSGKNERGSSVRMRARWPEGVASYLKADHVHTYMPTVRLIVNYIINGKPGVSK